MQRGLCIAIRRTASIGRSTGSNKLATSKFHAIKSSPSALTNEIRMKGIRHTARAALATEVTSLRVMGLLSGSPEDNLIRGWDAGVDADDDGG